MTTNASTKSKAKKPKKASRPAPPKYPRHDLERALRIPKGIMEQNAGKECSDEDSAKFIGIKYNRGPYVTELSSCVKFGLLERPRPGFLALTDISRNILKPQQPDDKMNAIRQAVLKAPEISDVYEHYRGENLPDEEFFNNALTDKFGIPETSIRDFKTIFFDSLRFAQLVEERDGKYKLLDVSGSMLRRRGQESASRRYPRM